MISEEKTDAPQPQTDDPREYERVHPNFVGDLVPIVRSNAEKAQMEFGRISPKAKLEELDMLLENLATGIEDDDCVIWNNILGHWIGDESAFDWRSELGMVRGLIAWAIPILKAHVEKGDTHDALQGTKRPRTE